MHKKPVFLLVLAVVAIFGPYQLKYYLGYASDLRSRPWAYSLDPGAKLLVGRWQGSFTDPAGIAKTLSLEIDLPLTEEERQKRATRRARRRIRAADKQVFDGTAVVVSRLGEERYTLYGSVDEADVHLVKMHSVPRTKPSASCPTRPSSRPPRAAGRATVLRSPSPSPASTSKASAKARARASWSTASWFGKTRPPTGGSQSSCPALLGDRVSSEARRAEKMGAQGGGRESSSDRNPG